jgi:hypothetical protein
MNTVFIYWHLIHSFLITNKGSKAASMPNVLA